MPQTLLRVVAGKPLLQHTYDRVSRVDKLDGIAVVATDSPSDDVIAQFCKSQSIPCLRGSVDDGLGRILAALRQLEATSGVIVSANAPLIDPSIVDHITNLIRMTDGMVDWIGTPLTKSYPRGMDAEAFTVAALDDSNRRCLDAQERRDGTTHLFSNSRLYRLLSVTAPSEQHRPDLDLSATQATMPTIEAVFQHFAGQKDFALVDIIAFIDSLARKAG